jgi:hypothetical protein
MYILSHLCVAKDFWNFKILDQFWKVLWIFKVLEFHIFFLMGVFLMWLISLYHFSFFFYQMHFIIWVLLITLCKINSCSMCCYSLLKVLNQNLNLKFHQMDFWFEFFEIRMNENTISCHDYHSFKGQKINIYPILTFFFFFFAIWHPFWLIGLWLHPCNVFSPERKHWYKTTTKCVSKMKYITTTT